MGNLCTRFAPAGMKKKKKNKQKRSATETATATATKPLSDSRRFSNASNGPGASSRWYRVRSSRKDKLNDSLIQDQGEAAAVVFQGHPQSDGSIRFGRSASVRYAAAAGSKKQSLLRSSSSRAGALADPPIQPHQLVNQNSNLDGLETSHIVLVHGGGFGAWCWYKTIALLEESGFKVTAIDLTGSGIDSFDSNGITTLSQYIRPLTEFFERLADREKVILVGHDFGGACVSCAMELFPSKVSKAVFVTAAMLADGQSTLDMFSQAHSNNLMQQAQIFLYGNGKNQPPTAIDLNKSLLRVLLFNQCSSKDVALASVSMRPIPFAPVLENLTLSEANYGSVRRFYVKSMEDNAFPVEVQERMIEAQPPEAVFTLKSADHSPFFSKPQALHKALVEISKLTL